MAAVRGTFTSALTRHVQCCQALFPSMSSRDARTAWTVSAAMFLAVLDYSTPGQTQATKCIMPLMVGALHVMCQAADKHPAWDQAAQCLLPLRLQCTSRQRSQVGTFSLD